MTQDMAKVKVTSPFWDKLDPSRQHLAGEVVSVSEERAADIESRGLGVWVDRPRPKAEQIPAKAQEPAPAPKQEAEEAPKAEKPKNSKKRK